MCKNKTSSNNNTLKTERGFSAHPQICFLCAVKEIYGKLKKKKNPFIFVVSYVQRVAHKS